MPFGTFIGDGSLSGLEITMNSPLDQVEASRIVSESASFAGVRRTGPMLNHGRPGAEGMNRKTEGPREVVMLSGAKHLSVSTPLTDCGL
jgi:hypothetical protein